MIKVKNRNIVVIGAARSGIAAALLLHKNGANVFVSDYNTIAIHQKERLSASKIEFEENGHSNKAKNADFAVVSPGVPSDSAIIQHYLKAGKNVYSEIEVASWFTDNKIIAITGSNGKTTVTSWIADVFETAKAKFSVAGNIGYAFSEKVSDNANYHILEVSSFQLDHIHTFKPHISLLLNITPDHLNRYNNNFDDYAAAKYRITENQSENDFFIYNADDLKVNLLAEELRNKKNKPALWAFSHLQEVNEGAFVRDNEIILKFNQKEEALMSVEEIGLSGQHNLYNGMATALAARAAEIKNETIRESLKSFMGVEHRLELVRVLDGVKYINDSKATNVNAVWFALDSIKEPVTLILGGRDKGNNYKELESLIHDKVHTIIAIGESKNRIKTQLKNVVLNYKEATSMKDAVNLAHKTAKRGEVVLLSPACASFDMYESYEERGNIFKKEVNSIK